MEIVKEFWTCGAESFDIRCHSLEEDGYRGAEFAISSGQLRVFFGDTGLAKGWAIVRQGKEILFVEASSSLDLGNGVEAEVRFSPLTEALLYNRMAKVMRFAKWNPESVEAEELERLRDALGLCRGISG
ncbi:MAG: hypothetical protein P1P90_04210 [Patescibacteria group bacterium]|nr:hypothetical protein [Patescibacteria group bacterium]